MTPRSLSRVCSLVTPRFASLQSPSASPSVNTPLGAIRRLERLMEEHRPDPLESGTASVAGETTHRTHDEDENAEAAHCQFFLEFGVDTTIQASEDEAGQECAQCFDGNLDYDPGEDWMAIFRVQAQTCEHRNDTPGDQHEAPEPPLAVFAGALEEWARQEPIEAESPAQLGDAGALVAEHDVSNRLAGHKPEVQKVARGRLVADLADKVVSVAVAKSAEAEVLCNKAYDQVAAEAGIAVQHVGRRAKDAAGIVIKDAGRRAKDVVQDVGKASAAGGKEKVLEAASATTAVILAGPRSMATIMLSLVQRY